MHAPRRNRVGRICRTLRIARLGPRMTIAIAATLPWLITPGAAVEPDRQRPAIAVDVSSLIDLQERFSQYRSDLPEPQTLGMHEILAYEEHPLFVYVCGRSGDEPAAGPAGQRRIVFLKPAVFVVDDRLGEAQAEKVDWTLKADEVRSTDDGGRQLIVRDRRIAWYPLPAANDADAETAAQRRELHVFHILPADRQTSMVQAALEASQLVVATAEREFRLTLPPVADAAAKIQIASADGATLLASRLLPAGVLPHGPQGVQMLERWDSAYRGGRAGWDTGRTASDLKEVVEQGVVEPGRTVELGCGSGINAIYLAAQGFDVTALDVAPTGLAQAEHRAQEAGVGVRWLLADVTAPPELEPFDFVFDRGCYHGVRRSHAAEYVEALRRLTRPGSKVLILAGNANEERASGPPRVSERELRDDFSKDFDFVWLKETRFDTPAADRAGALAWSILLERKSGQ